ncbi:MAG: 3'(2'),5'-bisphosphate nucleotidase CysQ [Flavobacteriales bacterium]|nr:3'(2'),5'-bisphosphate nucleotidase CysQ [Flavobacteriales bacterium]
MERPKIESLIETAIKAAIDASRVLMEHLEKHNEALVIRAKRDGSPVSAADMASHQIIESILSPTGIPLISEEGSLPPFSERQNWPLFWLVDPLDGTESYLRNRSGFAVNIALCDKNGPFLGIVADPLANSMYYGAIGLGAFYRSLDADAVGKALIEKPVTKPYLLVTSWNEPLTMMELLPSHLSPNDFRSEPVSGALKFCQVAAGKADLHARSGPYMEWDCAAGDAILRSMGLVVRSRGSNEPLKYNTMNLRVEGLWASRIP